MRKILIVLMTVLITGVFAGYGYSYQQGRGSFDGPPQKKELREKINMMRIWKLTEVLDLNEETASRLFPVLHKYKKERDELKHDMKITAKELEKAVNTGSDEEIRNILRGIKQSRDKLRGIEDKELAELRDILTVQQQAKYILFHQKFKRQIKKRLLQERERHSGRSGNEMPNAEGPYL